MEKYYATGRRKTAVAKVYLFEGTGKIKVNDKEVLDYFGRETLKMMIMQPMELLEVTDKYDVLAKVEGGGLSGQAGALQLGISRALIQANEDFRTMLRENGFLTRDPRMKERKKYGQKGARKRFQFSKR
ncbi:30S ribosomal protein S9 [candidate division KSB1 bacterium]|nr:MAG: 30S ribosomal protein S9 [candidate division KSB1 bacterium]